MLARMRPFPELEGMDRRMRRLFWEPWFAPVFPPVDVYETEGEFVVELEVPGFAEEELAIETFDHTLVVKGERAEAKEEERRTFFFKERLEKEFERRFVLPAQTDTERLTAEFRNGVLEVHAPKTAIEKPRTIAIGSKS
jgi:HSP20 family protein